MGKELQYFVSEAELRLVYNFKKNRIILTL